MSYKWTAAGWSWARPPIADVTAVAGAGRLRVANLKVDRPDCRPPQAVHIHIITHLFISVFKSLLENKLLETIATNTNPECLCKDHKVALR